MPRALHHLHALSRLTALLLCLLAVAMYLRSFRFTEYWTYRSSTTNHDLCSSYGRILYETSSVDPRARRGFFYFRFHSEYVQARQGGDHSLWGLFARISERTHHINISYWYIIVPTGMVSLLWLLPRGRPRWARYLLPALIFLAGLEYDLIFDKSRFIEEPLLTYLIASVIGLALVLFKDGVHALLRLPWRWKARRMQRRLALGLCLGCGYDLRGGHARCPECGRPCNHATAVRASAPAP